MAPLSNGGLLTVVRHNHKVDREALTFTFSLELTSAVSFGLRIVIHMTWLYNVVHTLFEIASKNLIGITFVVLPVSIWQSVDTLQLWVEVSDRIQVRKVLLATLVLGLPCRLIRHCQIPLSSSTRWTGFCDFYFLAHFAKVIKECHKCCIFYPMLGILWISSVPFITTSIAMLDLWALPLPKRLCWDLGNEMHFHPLNCLLQFPICAFLLSVASLVIASAIACVKVNCVLLNKFLLYRFISNTDH